MYVVDGILPINGLFWSFRVEHPAYSANAAVGRVTGYREANSPDEQGPGYSGRF